MKNYVLIIEFLSSDLVFLSIPLYRSGRSCDQTTTGGPQWLPSPVEHSIPRRRCDRGLEKSYLRWESLAGGGQVEKGCPYIQPSFSLFLPLFLFTNETIFSRSIHSTSQLPECQGKIIPGMHMLTNDFFLPYITMCNAKSAYCRTSRKGCFEKLRVAFQCAASCQIFLLSVSNNFNICSKLQMRNNRGWKIVRVDFVFSLLYSRRFLGSCGYNNTEDG